jgi:hypothetical protein
MTIPTSTIYVRPGLASYTWSYAGTAMSSAVTRVAFDAASLAGQAPSRGDLQYSTDGGRAWTTYTLPVDGEGAYVDVAGTLWRFQDRQGGDATTPDGFTVHYRLADGSVVTDIATVVPDTQPLGLAGSADTVFSTMDKGDLVDLLTAVDTGSQTGGRWVIESQSVSGLFAIDYDPAVDSAARLVIGDAASIPDSGLAASVTIHYYDRYQIDATGKPLNSTSGVTRTLNYTIEDGNTTGLDGLTNEMKLGQASNAFTANPAVATLTTGGVVAVWQAQDTAGGGVGLWAQLRDASGQALGSAYALTPNGNALAEGQPAVAALSGGRFVVAYAVRDEAGGAGRIAYRVVAKDGSAGAEHVVDAGAAGDAAMPALTALSDGSVALAWRSGGAVHVQQVGADGGIVGAQQHYGVLSSAFSPSIAALGQGGWVVSWGEINDGNVYAALKGGAAFLASGDGYAASFATAAPLPHVTALAGGGFVVAWDSYLNDQRGFSLSDIFFQRFDGAGSPVGDMVQANSGWGGRHFDAAVTALSDGSFLVAWQGGDGADNGIFGRRFGADGTAIDAQEFALNQLHAGDQASVDVTALAGGGFAAAWVDTAASGGVSIELRVLPGSGAATADPVQDSGQAVTSPAPVVTTPVVTTPVVTTPVVTTPVPTAPVTTAPVTTAPAAPSAPITAPASGSATGGQAGVSRFETMNGLDTVVYDGARSAYTISKVGSDVVVKTAAGASTTLTNVERITFSDQTVALDINGNAGDAYRLYQAAFNRTPDKAGLGFWIDALDTGHSLAEAANAFVNSAEFVTKYGANASDAQFVDSLYQNVLHRTPDASGRSFWLDALHTTSRAGVLVDFSDSAENKAQVSASIQNGIGYTPWMPLVDGKFTGSSAHNTMVAPSGVSKLDGMGGLDTVVYGGARSAYTISHSGNDFVVKNTAGTSTTLANVERIQFSDKTVALDIDGNAGDAYRLYQAAFNRTPDKAGLGFWIDALDTGHSLAEAADAFVNSTEFSTLYGANTTDAQFVGSLYANVLHRAPDAGGYAFWLDALHSTGRAEILVDFSQSAENQVQVIGSIQNGIEFTPWG